MAKNIYTFATVIHPENERAFINLLYNHAPECYDDVITSPLIGLLDPPLAELAMVKLAWTDKLEIVIHDDLMTLWCCDQDEEDTAMADAIDVGQVADQFALEPAEARYPVSSHGASQSGSGTNQ